MTIQLFFTILGLLVIFIGEIVYIREILKKNTKPHPFTWLGWSVLTAFISYVQFVEGAGLASSILFLESVMTFLIFLLALKYGDVKIDKKDFISFSLGIAAALLWYISETPFWSVILITSADVLMFIPTIRKTFAKPFDEELFEYYTSSLAYFFSFFALSKVSITTFFYPGVLIILNLIFIIFTLTLRKFFKDRENIKVYDADVKGLYDISLQSAKAKEKIVYIYEKYSLNKIIGDSSANEIRGIFEKNNVKVKQITNIKKLSLDKMKLTTNFKKNSEIKFVDKKIFNIKNEILIFDDTMVIYDKTAEKKLFIFKNKFFADSQKQLFKFLWNNEKQ